MSQAERPLNASTPSANAPVPEAVPAKPAAPAVAPVATTPRSDILPPFRVLLHNDDINDMIYVVEALLDLTPLDAHGATRVMVEAHSSGVALVLTTHRERAELYQEQFGSKGLTVTIEPV